MARLQRGWRHDCTRHVRTGVYSVKYLLDAFVTGFVGVFVLAIDLVNSALLILAMTCLALSGIVLVLTGMVMFGFLALCDYLMGEG